MTYKLEDFWKWNWEKNKVVEPSRVSEYSIQDGKLFVHVGGVIQEMVEVKGIFKEQFETWKVEIDAEEAKKTKSMTKKDDLQAELLAKVKPGTKPSHLKRSRSAGEIPKTPPLPADSFSVVVEQLKKDKEELTTQKVLLQDQLKEKQKEVEELRERLEETNNSLSSLDKERQNSKLELSELDQSLMARHQSLKGWFQQYQKNQVLETELAENIDEVSDELIHQDKKISSLQRQISQLQQTNQSLTRDLDSAHRLAQFRKNPYFSPQPDYPLLKYALYSLAVAAFSLWLTNSQKKPNG